MQRVSVALATALMLGGMSMAYAQGGPPQKENGPAQAQEQKGPSGATRGAQAQENQGSSSKSESRAERSGGESQRSAGQGGQDNGAAGKSSRQQAQDEGGRRQKDSDRASKQDDDSKSAQRSGQQDDSSKRAQGKDDGSKDAKRAGKEDDQTKDAKRADRDGDQSKDAKRADRDDDQSKDAKRADRDDRSQDDRKRADSGEDKKHVELKGDKEERVRNVFRERADVRERTDVDIDIHVGSRLPRDWEYYPVPAAVIEVVPEYRNYRFVYVEDRYVIVNPDTYEVVTVIRSDGSRTHAAAGGSGRCSADLTLSADDRQYLLRTVQMQNVDVGDVTIGMDVPSSVQLHTFPSPVTKRVSVLGQCRYFVTGDRIAIVDPNQHEVVVLVD